MRRDTNQCRTYSHSSCHPIIVLSQHMLPRPVLCHSLKHRGCERRSGQSTYREGILDFTEHSRHDCGRGSDRVEWSKLVL